MSSLVLDALSRGVLNGPQRPGPQMQSLYESYHWCLLCYLQATWRAAPTPDFNVMGNVMVLSLCSIVNSVTILWGIN